MQRQILSPTCCLQTLNCRLQSSSELPCWGGCTRMRLLVLSFTAATHARVLPAQHKLGRSFHAVLSWQQQPHLTPAPGTCWHVAEAEAGLHGSQEDCLPKQQAPHTGPAGSMAQQQC